MRWWKDFPSHLSDQFISANSHRAFVLFITYEKVPEAHDIFQRFTKVFEQNFYPIEILKKAEAQAREA